MPLTLTLITSKDQWVFRDYSDVDVKVVFDRQPLLGTGPLPDSLRNLAHGRSMVALDTYQDNLCLWRCIAVHRDARPDRSTTAARSLAKSFFKLRAPKTTPRKHRSMNLIRLKDTWIREQLSRIGLVSVSMSLCAWRVKWYGTLDETYQPSWRTFWQPEFTRGTRSSSRIFRGLQERMHVFIAFFPKHTALQNLFAGSNKKRRGGKFTFTTRHAGTAASGGLSTHLLTDTTPKRGLYFNTTAVTGTDAQNATRTIVIKSLPTMTKKRRPV